jgi:hypothetical protein
VSVAQLNKRERGCGFPILLANPSQHFASFAASYQRNGRVQHANPESCARNLEKRSTVEWFFHLRSFVVLLLRTGNRRKYSARTFREKDGIKLRLDGLL